MHQTLNPNSDHREEKIVEHLLGESPKFLFHFIVISILLRFKIQFRAKFMAEMPLNNE